LISVADQETIAGALITGLAAIAASIRWSVGRIAKSSDRATTVMIELSKTSGALSAKFDSLAEKFDSLAARFDRIVNTLLRDRDRGASQVDRRIRSRTEGRRRPTTSRELDVGMDDNGGIPKHERG